MSDKNPTVINIKPEESKNANQPQKSSKSSQKRKPPDVDYHMNKYEETISNLTNELEALRHQVAVKTHSQYLSSNPDIQSQPNSKFEKISMEISSHFQAELRMKRELIESEKQIEHMTSNLKEKEFQLFKQMNAKIGGNMKMLKEKEIRSQITKMTEQINLLKSMMVGKENKYNDLMKKRENFENIISKYSKDKRSSNLQYLYQCYMFEINNLINEHIRRRNVNEIRKKDLKIAKLLEQLKIRDEYINIGKKELSRKNVNFTLEEDAMIKNVDDMNFDRSFSLPAVFQQQEIVLPSPTHRKNQSSGFLMQRTPNDSKYDYSGYNNPHIVKEKLTFKTKTNEIIKKSKQNKLTPLKLNILNDLYKSSKVVYVNKKSNRNYQDNTHVVIDSKLLNKSQSNAFIHTNGSQSDLSNSRMNIKEREIDYKLRKIWVRKKKISPYLNIRKNK